MKSTRHLLPVFLAALMVGCSLKPSQTPSPVKLDTYGFPGLVLTINPAFPPSEKAEINIPCTFTLTNMKDTPVSIKHWSIALRITNLGNGTMSDGNLIAQPETLQPGMSLSLPAYFYMGPSLFSKMPTERLSIGLAAIKSPQMIAAERKYGDCLVGVEMSLATDKRSARDIYLAKYHFESATRRLKRYYMIGQ